MSGENLDNLIAEAGALETEAAPPPAADAPEAAAHDLPAEVAALLQTTAAMLAPMFPSLAKVYTEETCRSLGVAAAPVMQKYGLTVGGIFDRWGAEITLAATALPVAVATYEGVRSDLAARKKTESPAAAPSQPASAEGVGKPAPDGEDVPNIAGMLVIPAPSK